jgi:RHS repeat-associated protein
MQYDSFGNLLSQQGNVVRLPLGFAGGLFDPDTGLTRFVWRDYDADTGRFTALDPLREKGGDKDWYGYCVDDPVNRVDVWGLAWSLFGGGSEPAAADGGQESPKPRTGRDDNPYCKDNPCDDNGTMQGDYKPIEGREGVLPFMLQYHFMDPIVWPFMNHYERNKEKE